MPRTSRQHSLTGYYHVILRGVNRQNIFFDNADREKFLQTIARFSDEENIEILVYCLMNNHVHLLLHANIPLDRFIKKTASSYVYYFNRKYDRIGHLFQDRFKSEPIDTEKYLLTVARYILQNPKKAGISNIETYPWNSWNELESEYDFCRSQILSDLTGGISAFKDYVRAENNDVCADIEEHTKISDDEALTIIRQITGLGNPIEIKDLPWEKRNEYLVRIKNQGLTIRQISRITALNKNMIQRAR